MELSWNVMELSWNVMELSWMVMELSQTSLVSWNYHVYRQPRLAMYFVRIIATHNVHQIIIGGDSIVVAPKM
jgi:hypothetical protein